jgi:hypothetical protein
MEKLAAANGAVKVAEQQHAQKYTAEIDKLEYKETQLLDRIKQLDERKESIAKVSGDLDATSEDLVEINAGGKVIALTRSTLTQIEGSRLSALFSGRYDKKLIRDINGRIFLDVNPVCFQAIVDYLVDYKTASEDNPPTPPSVDSEYQADLMHTLELFGINADVALAESQIVEDTNHANHICDWLVEDKSYGDFVLLYRSSRDGRNDQTFHSKCDNKGSTYVDCHRDYRWTHSWRVLRMSLDE